MGFKRRAQLPKICFLIACSMGILGIGCGGSGGSPGNPFAGSWFGLITGSDGSAPNANVVISSSGQISGWEQEVNGSNVLYQLTGSVTADGTFHIVASYLGAQEHVMTGTVTESDLLVLTGVGTSIEGAVKISINFTFRTNGSSTSGAGASVAERMQTPGSVTKAF